MENGSQTVARRRYPFFLKKPVGTVGMDQRVEGSSESRPTTSTHTVSDNPGNGCRDECCAPGLRLPGCGLEAEVGRIRSCNLRSRIIRNIIVCPSAANTRQVVRSIRECVSGTGFGTAASWIALSAHPKEGWHHVHIAHDCPYRKSTCTCAFLNPYRKGGQGSSEGPYLGRKKGHDLRPIFGEQCKKAEDSAIVNILQ